MILDMNKLHSESSKVYLSVYKHQASNFRTAMFQRKTFRLCLLKSLNRCWKSEMAKL